MSTIAAAMGIRVLLADDGDVMRVAIVRVLMEDPAIEFVGEAVSFAETLRLAAALKPDVLLVDLHMPDEHEYKPELLKIEFLQYTQHVLALSIWNDDKANELAAALGAHALLDKAKLYYELVPAIKECGLSVVKRRVRKMSSEAAASANQQDNPT